MRAGDLVRASIRLALTWVALAVCLVWSVSLVVTVVRVQQLRADLSRLAADVAHHNAAHHTRADAGSRRYLEAHLHSGVGRKVRSASVRVVGSPGAAHVEVRLDAVIGFAILGHPKIGIVVVRSEPIE